MNRGVAYKILTVLTSALVFSSNAFAVGEQPPGNLDKPVIQVVASRFHYTPAKIVLKKGRTVIIEIQSDDRLHGFAIPELNLRADAKPGLPTRIEITPEKTGTLAFFCDIFCGAGHEEMGGEIVVED